MAGFFESLAKGDIAGAAGAAVDGAGEAVKGMGDKIKGTGDAIKAIPGQVQGQIDSATAQTKDAAEKAKKTGASVMSAITGEEAPRELTGAEVKEVQSALGLGQGAVGPKTIAGVTKFAQENGIDPATIISADHKHLIGTPEFLGAIETKKHVDLSFYTPTKAVQERVADTLGDYAAKARDGVVNTGKEALGWLEQKARDLCAATGNVNPDGSCKAPEATPGRRTGGVERD